MRFRMHSLDGDAFDLIVAYAPAIDGGYPTSVSIDWRERMIDEETYFTIEDVSYFLLSS